MRLCPDLTDDQVFLAVDYLTRSGQAKSVASNAARSLMTPTGLIRSSRVINPLPSSWQQLSRQYLHVTPVCS